jgi:enamine deaminase RidA (YjgF/YER057c/UK114 family)
MPTRLGAEYVPMPGAGNLPFSALVRVGPLLYLSGQLGTDSTGRLVTGGIGPETAQTLANIRALLASGLALGARIELECTALAGRG